MNPGLLHFVRAKREILNGNKEAVRLVYRSEISQVGSRYKLDDYISDRVPLFYRSLDAIYEDLKAGFFMSAFNTTLAKLPNSEWFQESHFGEIVACLFAEEVLGWGKLYSKLSLLSTENANANKMDLVMYDLKSNPVRFIFGEVKCSPKSAKDGLPANHDKSCFADIFNSMNKYSNSDREFDLTAARDNLKNIPEKDRDRVREALKPYSDSIVDYAGFALIDQSTFCHKEAQVLRTRKNLKSFEIDLLCIESFSQVAETVYKTCSPRGL